jgi:ankyrin repeat protein
MSSTRFAAVFCFATIFASAISFGAEGEQQGVDVNATRPDGTTALHWAVRADDGETADLLIRAGANVAAADRYGVQPLFLASLNASAGMIDKLLRAGADPNSANPSGETSLMTAARTGSVEAVKILLDRGAAVDAKESVRGQTALMWAVAQNHPAVVRLLHQRGADINAASSVFVPPAIRPDRVGQAAGAGITRQKSPSAPQGKMTPLLYAARDGNVEMLRLLLELKADIKLTDANGTSPLVFALVNGHVSTARFLLENGADPNAADGYGRAALFAAIDLRNLDRRGHVETTELLSLIEELLVRGWQQREGSWVNFTGQTPFLRASLSGDVTTMRLLVKYKADPNLATAGGTTPLMAVAGINWVANRTFTHSARESLEAARLCVELGNDVNAANSMGLTAMHGAANRGANDIIRFLAEKGAKLDAKDAEGRTPMDFAEGVFLAVIPPVRKPATMALLRELIQ